MGSMIYPQSQTTGQSYENSSSSFMASCNSTPTSAHSSFDVPYLGTMTPPNSGAMPNYLGFNANHQTDPVNNFYKFSRSPQEPRSLPHMAPAMQPSHSGELMHPITPTRTNSHSSQGSAYSQSDMGYDLMSRFQGASTETTLPSMQMDQYQQLQPQTTVSPYTFPVPPALSPAHSSSSAGGYFMPTDFSLNNANMARHEPSETHMPSPVSDVCRNVPPPPAGSVLRSQNSNSHTMSSDPSQRHLFMDNVQMRSAVLQRAQQQPMDLSHLKQEKWDFDPTSSDLISGSKVTGGEIITRNGIHVLRIFSGRFKCTEPGCKSGTFKRSEHLKRHTNTCHRNSTVMSCPYCDHKFSREDNFRSHIKLHASNRGDKARVKFVPAAVEHYSRLEREVARSGRGHKKSRKVAKGHCDSNGLWGC